MSIRGHLPPGSVGDRLSLQNQTDLDTHTQIMTDPTKHEEEKLRAVQEIWDKTEVYIANNQYYQPMEKFLKTAINYLQESNPQFIAENTVQKLRQKCLELILRMACHDATKNLVKDISKVVLRLITVDNEKNAVLGLKILNDVWKQTKIYFIPEISTAVNFLKSIVKEMNVHMNNGMFEPQDFQSFRGPMAPTLDDNLVESYLNHCYHIQFISVAGSRGEKVEFTLIPRSSVSLKVVQELSVFFVYMFQHHKQTMINDVTEFLIIALEFICLQLPANYKDFQGMVKEIMDDFHTAQAKILGFLTIMGKITPFMDVMLKNGTNLLKAILTLMETLDDKNVVIRKEILMSLKFCFATDLKNHVVTFLPRLLDEDCIVGRGYTTKDNLRVFLYQILADLLHHIRFQLNFPLLLQSSAVFCREMADPTLSFQTQVMCVRLLCSICEALPKMEQTGEASRDMLWQTLDHLQYKIERIATYHLPLLIKTHGLEDANGKRITQHELLNQEQRPSSSGDKSRKASQDQGLRASTDQTIPDEEMKEIPKDIPLPEVQKKSSRFTKPDQMLTELCAVASPAMTVTEARNFVKYLLHTVKICCGNIQTTARSKSSYPMEKERDIMENILKYGLICMDVFMLPNSSKNQPIPPGQRGKEEKEALDIFAHVFVTMDSDIYKEIFAKHICTIIERINSNSTVQLFANAFLVRSDFVCRFGGIMIRYLMENMDKLAVSNDRTTLYVKLFKIIFSAIGCGQQITTEGEMMLKPYLPDLIRKATEYALTAKEPLNYFLLLRALFRSIGGGAHDILYGQFLPLLPNLLQFLNKLQSCNHRITMRELFLELCLTVPVRLSSLLPYLPLLMDPLVCALNGSTSLVQQGLRTLELCVDNLQPEYLFEHMAPVRSALIQGLWRVLSASSDAASAQTAFRILGKFGGANRRILSSPQTLTYINDNEIEQACICIEFPRNSPELPPLKVDFSLSEIIQTVVEQMGNICYRIPRLMYTQPDSSGNVSTLIPHQMASQTHPAHYQLVKESSMALARCILSASLCPDPNMSAEDWKHNVIDNLKDALKRLDTNTPLNNYYLFRGARQQERKMYINALVVIMVGVIQKDLRPQYVNFYMGIVRQLTINSLLESISAPEPLGNPYNLCLDGSILVDALIEVLGDTNKEFLNSAVFCLSQFCDTCDVCIPDKSRWYQFPIIRHLIESVCNLCNGPAWFARLGGANGLLYIIKSYPVELLRGFVVLIVESLCEVIVGLSDEISSGAIDMSVSALVHFHKRVFNDYDMSEDRLMYLSYIVGIYLPLIFHNIEYVREKAWELLNSLKESGAPSMTEMFRHHLDIIIMNKERIIVSLRCMSMTEQEASLCALNTLLEIIPERIGLDFGDASLRNFFDSVFDLCENDVHTLLSRDYYKSMDTCPGHFLPPYPMATQMENLKAVAIQNLIISYKVLCRDQPGDEEKKETFSKKVLTIAVQSALFGPERIQTSATNALNKCSPIPMEALRDVAGSIISSFDESDGSFDVEKIAQMEKLIGFNSELWNKELAQKFVELIKSWQTSANDGFPARSVEDIKAIQSVMRLVMGGDVLDQDMVLKMVNFLAFFDLNYTTDSEFGFIGSICALIDKYPQEIVRHFCSRSFLTSYVPFIIRILEHDKGQSVRDVLKNDIVFLEKLLQLYTLEGEEWEKNYPTDLESCIGFEESIVKILDALVGKEAEWFESNHQLLEMMRKIWSGTEFIVRYNVQPVYGEENDRKMVRISLFPASKINVPHLYGRLFIRYLKQNPDNIEMLFDLMHAFDGTFGADFAFMRDFLENDLIPKRSIPWRIKALEHVLQKLENKPAKYVKAPIISKMFQYVVLPCLQYIFERYDCDEILGSGLPPDEETHPDPNHCMTRLTTIIEKNKQVLSEPNVIAMYQLCTLLVEYAPGHIHNNECKKQGTRLRTFMVFVWVTLSTGSATSTTTHSIDPTVRFTGYLFLAHLIDKFSISKKIVLQVFNTLIAQYQLDNRDLIRKAIDVVTPAVPIRLQDDGYQQLLIHIKKVIAEESHNMAQIQHVVQAVCRNYRVYYHVRHELIQPMISAVTRVLNCTSGAMEGLTGRKLSLDVCEMAIKWELLKKKDEETESSQSQDMEVDSYLETLKNGDKDDQTGDDIKKEPKQTVISKEHIDQIVGILLKFACSLQYQGSNPNAPSAYLSTTNELARRAQGLLRASLKPYVWGEVAEVKYQWIEKQLTIPSEFANSRPESQHVFAQHIQQAQTTLEVLLALASSMNRPLLLSVLKPLQRSLISCMVGNYSGVQGHALVKTMNYLLGKLLEKSKTVAHPLEELETLNQYIGKYINEAMANYVKGTSSMVQSIFTPFSVLRSIMAHMPSYLDITCMSMFLRVLEKVVREQISPHPGQENNRDKTTIDFLLVALELVRQRSSFMSAEQRRVLVTGILIPLIDKTHYEKVFEGLFRVTLEILNKHTDRSMADPGLILTHRLHSQIERRLNAFSRMGKDPHSYPLMAPYLNIIYTIFENPVYQNTEQVPRMYGAFYWGLTSPDPETRRKFLSVWERNQEPFLLSRFLWSLKEEGWQNFRKYYWIRHVVWLLTQSCLQKPYPGMSPKRVIYFRDCITLAKTLEVVAGRDNVPSLGAVSMDPGSTFNSPSENGQEAMDTSEPVEKTVLDKLVDGQRHFLLDAMAHDTSQMLTHVYNMMFHMPDGKFTPKIFKRLFMSIWYELLPNEKQEFEAAIVPFLTSGVHNHHVQSPNSVLTTWLEAVESTRGEIKLPPKLVHFISKTHNAWHKGLLHLEGVVRYQEHAYSSSCSGEQIRDFMSKAYGSNEHVPYRESLDYLALLYKDMEELDPYAAIWNRRAIMPETVGVLNRIQRGEIKEAQRLNDEAIMALADKVPEGGQLFTPPLDQEVNHLFEQYTYCCEELLDWERLRDYANHNTVESPYLLMKSAMHLPDWPMVRDCLDQMVGCVPQKYISDYHLYQMMNLVMSPRRETNENLNPLQTSQNHHQILKQKIEKFVDDTVTHHIALWRGLPSVVSNAHYKVLQAASLIREVADCVDLRIAIEASTPREFNAEVINQMKHIIKVWRNRLCCSADELSYYALVYDWRIQIHQMTLRRLEEWDANQLLIPHGANSQTILPVHSAAQGQMVVARAAKSMRNYELAIEQMNKLHTISAVPAMDAHTKICEHLKVIRQQADRTIDPEKKTELYQLGLHLLNETDITYLAADQVSRIFTIRGQFLGGLDKREEAYKAFTYATQIIMEKQPATPPTAAFKAWGDHQDSLLQNDQTELVGMTAGSGALACFLEVARSVDSESRPKKYIGKLIWTGKRMVSRGESAASRMNKIIEMNERTTVSYNWLPWVPQLINEIMHRPQSNYVLILARVCEDFPLQIFYNLRCILSDEVTEAVVRDACLAIEPLQMEIYPEWMQKLIPLMKQAISYRPADCRMFHELLSQMNSMREFWAERQHRYAVAVRNEITSCIHRQYAFTLPQDMVLDQEAISAIMEWKADFETYSGGFMRELEMRYLADEYCHSEEIQFIQQMTVDIQRFFSFCPCDPGTIVRYLEQVTEIRKKLGMRLAYLPRKIPLKLASPWLASFTNKMACIEMPKDLFNVQKTVGTSSKYTSSQYTSMLGRLDPYFSISLEGGEVVRKIYMRSINGKSCTYYLKKTVKDKAGAFECSQFMGHLNQLLAKERETSRRFLQTCVMNQVYVGYGCNLIETSGGVIGENQLVGSKSPVMHPYEILRQRLSIVTPLEPDEMVVMFYDQLPSVIEDMEMKRQQEVQMRQQATTNFGEEHFIGRNNIMNWAINCYPDATMYYNFRKQIAKHMAVLNTTDFLLQLVPPQLQDIYITRSFGQYTIPNYGFQHPDKMEQRPVPFRLTHNFYNFLGFSADGDMRYCSEATISCMRYRSPEVYLRPLLWDFSAEISPKKSYLDHIATVDHMINGMRQRILTHDKPNDDKSPEQEGVAKLMRLALSTDRMAQNDPATYPWF